MNKIRQELEIWRELMAPNSAENFTQERKTMTKFSEAYKGSSNSLKAEDLQGKPRKLRIKGSFENEYDGKLKRVLEFENTDKTLVLNFTNGLTIENQCGEIEDWPGNEIIIYPTKVDFGGKMVDAIRVREIVPDPGDDDIPF